MSHLPERKEKIVLIVERLLLENIVMYAGRKILNPKKLYGNWYLIFLVTLPILMESFLLL